MHSSSTSLPESAVGATPVVANTGAAAPVSGAATRNLFTQQSFAVPARVLIVEDDPRGARILQANLSASGHTVVISVDGNQARQQAAADPPDLILCDVCLPDTDGIELTRWFRRQPATSAVPVVLITSSDDTKILGRGLEAGADDFLTKPVNSLELRTRVQSLLRSKFLADELRARECVAAPFRNPACTDAPPAASHAVEPVALQALNAQDEILIVEDNPQEARLLQAYLADFPGRALVAHDAQSARDVLDRNAPSLVVMDLILPDRSGYEMIQEMKANPRLEHIPILVVSAMTQVEDRVKALQLGADDFIVKGFDRVELTARARRLLRHKQHLDTLRERCQQAMQQAVTDSLTGLFTHGFLQEILQRQIACARRDGQPLSLIFADIDHFKNVNDRYGHAAGDHVLRTLAATMRDCVRQGDTLVRYGGEEFVALLPHTSVADATTLAERLRTAVERLVIDAPQGSSALPGLTLSLGVAGFPQNATDGASLLEHADEAMYLAKQAGRNRVVVFGQQPIIAHDARKVLLVDDDEKNLRLLEAYLQPEEYELLKAHDGAEALELARRSRPDLILLDAMMPRLSGFDVCRRLKQESDTCLIPVILVTALNGKDDRLRGMEAGADDFLSKPIDKVELVTRTRALLRAKRATDSLEDAETVILALARAVEARDPLTGGHVDRVTKYAVAMGKAIGLAQRDLEDLRRAAIVHDIGKILIPDAVLLKPGPLTPDERKIIEQHVEAGYQLLRPLRTFGPSLNAVRFHHERQNGSGYPFGLKGDQIPIAAQVLGVVDVYDALTSERGYRKILNPNEAAGILRDEATRGLHDPQLVEEFFRVLELQFGCPLAERFAATFAAADAIE